MSILFRCLDPLMECVIDRRFKSSLEKSRDKPGAQTLQRAVSWEGSGDAVPEWPSGMVPQGRNCAGQHL